jgi:hypothetical protein
MENQQEQQSNRDQGQQVNSEQGQQNRVEQGSGQRQEFEPVGQRQQTQTIQQGNGQSSGGLMGGQEMQKFSSQWTSIQAAFVDEPRKAVEQADRLVEEVIQHMSKSFANERQNLEGQWSRGDQVSTEDLRVALQRYRQFFQSLLRT